MNARAFLHLLNRALWRGFVWLLFIASVEFAWQMYEMGLLWWPL